MNDDISEMDDMMIELTDFVTGRKWIFPLPDVVTKRANMLPCLVSQYDIVVCIYCSLYVLKNHLLLTIVT